MPVYDEFEDWRPPKRSRYADSDDDDRPKLDIKPLGLFGSVFSSLALATRRHA